MRRDGGGDKQAAGRAQNQQGLGLKGERGAHGGPSKDEQDWHVELGKVQRSPKNAGEVQHLFRRLLLRMQLVEENLDLDKDGVNSGNT